MDKRELMALASRLDHVFGRLELICDGHVVTAEVQQCGALRYEVMVFVDGQFRGEWMITDHQVPDFVPKFYREVSRFLFGKKTRDHMASLARSKYAEIRVLGKGWDRKFTVRHSTWPSGRAFLAHIAKTCASIELAPEAHDVAA
jgi:hypothetical protein